MTRKKTLSRARRDHICVYVINMYSSLGLEIEFQLLTLSLPLLLVITLPLLLALEALEALPEWEGFPMREVMAAASAAVKLGSLARALTVSASGFCWEDW